MARFSTLADDDLDDLVDMRDSADTRKKRVLMNARHSHHRKWPLEKNSMRKQGGLTEKLMRRSQWFRFVMDYIKFFFWKRGHHQWWILHNFQRNIQGWFCETEKNCVGESKRKESISPTDLSKLYDTVFSTATPTGLQKNTMCEYLINIYLIYYSTRKFTFTW